MRDAKPEQTNAATKSPLDVTGAAHHRAPRAPPPAPPLRASAAMCPPVATPPPWTLIDMNDPSLQGDADGGAAVAGSKLRQHVPHVGMHRFLADAERGGNLPIAHALRNQLDHLNFTLCEPGPERVLIQQSL